MQDDASSVLLQKLDSAVSGVFSLMLNRVCVPAEPLPCVALPSRSTMPGYIASVRFSGALRGNCAIFLDWHAAILLAMLLTGEPAEAVAPLAADTAGELCNMIAGAWKSSLPALYAACQLSCPDVTVQHLPLAAMPITRVYRFSPHQFTLQLSLG